jgi:hypothetical protein
MNILIVTALRVKCVTVRERYFFNLSCLSADPLDIAFARTKINTPTKVEKGISSTSHVANRKRSTA